jgi:hypothetical protein
MSIGILPSATISVLDQGARPRASADMSNGYLGHLFGHHPEIVDVDQ